MAVDLGGDGWQLKACLGDEWRWHLTKPWDAAGWLPARVPGSVLDDLARAGEVPDLYRERNSLLAEWVPQRSWILRRRVPAGRVRFDGVDHEATVFVDGEEVGRHEGAFTPFEVEVPDGEHLLAVVIHPAPESESQVGHTSRVRVHKPRMNYGWDFCPRLVHQGIWRPVTLDPAPEAFPVVRLDGDVGTVEVDGEVVLRVDSPERWWPNGMGAQRLYPVPELGIEVGFRTVELVPTEGAPEEALPYGVVVNGRAMPVNGWNWVPVDALYGVPRPDKLAHLLGLAARANVNLLRVWGGGLIETPEFYELCDRLGILVWQEFSQSSSGIENVPSTDPAFVELMRAEARAIVPRRRGHPSLAIWCGGNELWADDSSPAIAALREVVRELDPGRGWYPTSPTGPDHDHDVHGPWEHQGLRAHYEHYETRTSLLHSEFGVQGMTNRRALEALIGEERRWPADRSNPVYEHLGAWWNNADFVREAFGGRIDDLETMRRASQWLQYEGLRYAVEAQRRRWPRCSGTLPWQLNESYPNAWCTSALDHRGDPKPAYWGVARAYRGAPSASFATCAWGGEEEFRAETSAPARVVDLTGAVVAETGGGTIAAPLDAIATDVFLLDVDGRTRYAMSKTATLEPLLDLPRTELRLHRRTSPSSSLLLGIENAGEVAAVGVVLEDARPYDAPGWVLFSDNVLDLLPGETREIEVEGPAAELRVEGWNARA
ncbi:MAG TPA: glycoside hydrolase family 2 TIM barrel-domain containing protein [Gaiellaceae bacterium]|nr:glycoside hydrolase family 2 TIM barrel-domain containing protein [Gaiellaceae bacterium]